MKKILIYSIIGFTLSTVLSTSIIVYYGSDEKPILNYNIKNDINNSFVLDSASLGVDLKSEFPIEKYNESIYSYSIPDIIYHISILNKKYPNDTLNNLMFLHSVYFDYIIKKDSVLFKSYNPELIWKRMTWIDRFKLAEESKIYDPNTTILFNAIYGSWMQYIVDNLYGHYKANHKLKYLSSYKMLKMECELRQYSLGLGQTRSEKIIERFTHNEFSYLYRKFLQEVNGLMLLVIIVLGSIFIYGIICIYKVHIKK